MSNKNDNEKPYTFVCFLSDVLSVIILVLILDLCGCGICEKIGSIIGDGYNSFAKKTSQQTSQNNN